MSNALDVLLSQYGTIKAVADALGVHPSTVKRRAAAGTLDVSAATPTILTMASQEAMVKDYRLAELETEVKALRSHIAATKKETLDEMFVKSKIIKLANTEPLVPDWIKHPKTKSKKSYPGTPTLFASDWHFGEVVDPSQVGGLNEYNMEIAGERCKRLIERTTNLLLDHFSYNDYPGIVFAIGGDMVSGDLHDELSATNEIEIMPTVIELFGKLSWCIDSLSSTFGKVYVPCVSGNHGRNTHKTRHKGRNFTNFDWLVYCLLQKRFEGNSNITFNIPNGPDCLYEVEGHKYLLTHGDKLGNGGDGIIGALGPVIRGDHRRRGRQSQIGQPYDTMLCGHFHQLIQLERIRVNGSLKGYCEYAYTNSYGFERPRQGLWLTHPEQGITFSMPVNVD